MAWLFLAATARAQGPSLDVTDFGARGDAVSFLVATVDNSAAVTIQSTNRLSSADVGKLILLFGVGPATTSSNNQDLITTIQSVSNGTNLILATTCGATASGVYTTCGTQNAAAFQACVAACRGASTTVLIPAGRFLLVPPVLLSNVTPNVTTLGAVTLSTGGIHFLGTGIGSTILLGNGAWKLAGGSAYRGELFDCQGPVTNNYPVTFDSLTLDGGVTAGNTTNHNFPASPVDGTGWDETHDAVVDTGPWPLHFNKQFLNCKFTHWRGEMVKSVCGCGDGFIGITNCLFDDGDATAFNFTFTHTIDHCVFSNLFQALEFYEGYNSNACFFQNNLLTNITGNAFALNGGMTNHVIPAYNIVHNTFNLAGNYGIVTTPAVNVNILSNQFNGGTYVKTIGLGCQGYQGNSANSNIVVAYNVFDGGYFAVEELGGAQNFVANVNVFSNLATGLYAFADGYGWSTNISFFDNVSATGLGLVSGNLVGQWFLDEPSNQFPSTQTYDATGRTNILTYATGMRQQITAVVPNSVFVLDDTHPQQVPPGAVLDIQNVGTFPVTLYASASMTGLPITLTNGFTATSAWTNGAWNLSGNLAALPAPTNLHIVPGN